MTTKSIVVEREMPHAPEKIWRALTSSALIADWLMANDFEPEPGRKFQFRSKPMPGWTGVTNCEVTELDPPRRPALDQAGPPEHAEMLGNGRLRHARALGQRPDRQRLAAREPLIEGPPGRVAQRPEQQVGGRMHGRFITHEL